MTFEETEANWNRILLAEGYDQVGEDETLENGLIRKKFGLGSKTDRIGLRIPESNFSGSGKYTRYEV